MNWNLNNIYPSLQCKEFTEDTKLLENTIDNAFNWININFKNHDNIQSKILYFIDFKNKAEDLLSKLGPYSYLISAADTKNTLAMQTLNKMLTFEPKILSAEREFQNWLLAINNLPDIIHKSFKDYEYYLSELINNAKHMPTKNEVKLLGKMKSTGSMAWENLHRIALSNLKIEIELQGKKELLPLQALQGLSANSDLKIREKVFKAKLSSYNKISETAAWAYNSIKGEQITEAELKGYNSVFHMAMDSYKLKEVTVTTMFKVIKKYLPTIQKGINHKAKLLGYDDALPFYALFAPLGKNEKCYSFDETKSIILDNLKDFGCNMYSIAKKVFDENWIDSEPRENKRSGGFSVNLHSLKESRILFNFAGTSDNILQLSHEIGHVYHYACLNTEASINSNCSLAVMESAAIFTENFLQQKLLKISSQNEKLSMLNEILMRDIKLILDIYAYYNFESKVLEIRKNRILAYNELCELLKNAFAEAYGTSIDKETIDKYMWMTLPQLFYSNRPYYMVSYAFGLLFTKGLYASYIKDKSNFVKNFDYFLSISGKCSVEDAAVTLGIDLTSEEFWISSLKLVEEDINNFINENN
ncbi:M3 family metallopeptidase [Clostridium hydrogenum]|uniref:M3 family metallopeptidase n=1 Tax=Clostridium hydrogenum TaxID=2855764 RepID=UPI001F32B87F|nr:M3 family metallopeptidase [Clostridium hydrogenum]